jgi:hypothetical protein
MIRVGITWVTATSSAWLVLIPARNLKPLLTPVLRLIIDRSIGTDISGLIFDAPPDEALLKEVADFMWNFGRQPHTSIN